MRDVTYIINTHCSYTLPVERLLISMKNINPRNIIAVVAQCAEYKYLELDSGMQIYNVMHNSFDFTGAITLFDYNIRTHDHILFLQDTMELGNNSDTLIRNAPDGPAISVFGGQCNLILFKRTYLEHHRKWILERRNLSKLESIQYEGMLWKMTSEHISYPDSCMEILGVDNPYSGAERIKEYYSAIDLIKWKANYGQNMHSMILHP